MESTRATIVLVVGTEAVDSDRYVLDDAPHLEVLVVPTLADATESLEDVDVVVVDRASAELEKSVPVFENERSPDCDWILVVVDCDPHGGALPSGVDAVLSTPVSGADLLEAYEIARRREEYDEKLHSYFSVVSAAAAMEVEYDDGALATDPEYRHLVERRNALRDELDGLLTELTVEEGFAVSVWDERNCRVYTGAD